MLHRLGERFPGAEMGMQCAWPTPAQERSYPQAPLGGLEGHPVCCHAQEPWRSWLHLSSACLPAVCRGRMWR
jgi:hypothetical protein